MLLWLVLLIIVGVAVVGGQGNVFVVGFGINCLSGDVFEVD